MSNLINVSDGGTNVKQMRYGSLHYLHYDALRCLAGFEAIPRSTRIGIASVQTI